MKTFLLPLAAVALLTGCSFSVPDAEPRESSPAVAQSPDRTVVLSGTIKLSGANPSVFISDPNARTAFPAEPTASSLNFSVTAARSGSSDITITTSDSPNGLITVESSTGIISYTINLPSGSWSLSACAKDSTNNTILATTQNVTANLSESATISPLVLRYVSSSSTEKGNINLHISAMGDSGIGSIKATGDLSATNNSSSWNWTVNDVSPGSYNVDFIFYSGTDCTGDILYRIKEVINVYSNLTTTKFETSPIGYVSSGNIEVTKALVQSAELTTIYVNSSGDDDGTGSCFSPVKTLARAIELVNTSPATGTPSFEIVVQNNVSLGRNITLNSGKKAFISSENTSSAATVSGGSSNYSLTISGEAEVSYLNFSGLGKIETSDSGKLTLDGSISSDSKIYLSSKDNPLELGSSFTTASPITVELNTTPTDTSRFAFGDLAIKATEEQVDYFTTPTDSTYSFVYNATKAGAIMAHSSEETIIYVGGADASDITGTGSETAPFATLYRAVADAKDRYVASPDNYIIKVQDEITESQDIEVEAVPGLTIEGNVSEGSTDTIQVNGGGKSITFSCNTTLKNLEFKSFAESSQLKGPITIAYSVVVEAEYVTVTECTNTNGDGGGIYNAGTLTLTNCTVSKNTAACGGGIYINSNASADIIDSIIESNTATSSDRTARGGGIFVNGDGSLTLSGSGSKITKNKADSSSTSASDKNAYGGGIFCYGSMLMKDGIISENTLLAPTDSAKYGGGIALAALSESSNEEFEMQSGTISKNSARHGGGISTQGTKITLSGGTIGAATYDDGNKATQFGGGLYVGPYRSGSSTKKPDCTISDCTIKYNTANESGGGIFAEQCTITFSSGSISNNKVYSDTKPYISGGGVYIKEGSLGISEPAEISNNTVSAGSPTTNVSGGGLFIYKDGIVTMEGGSIKANTISATSSAMGGGVYIFEGGKITLSGGTVISNTASYTSTTGISGAMGGGFYIYNSGELTMTGGSINNNEASATNGNCLGGGIYSFGKLTLTDGELKANKCRGSSEPSGLGGGIFAAPPVSIPPATDIGSFTLDSTTTISGNSAYTGANYYINTGVYVLGTIGGDTYSTSTLLTSPTSQN